MASPDLMSGITTAIDFQDPLLADLAAVIPYVFPLIFIGTTLLLYQRYMPHEEMKRNLVLFVGFLCVALSIFLILYAGFGSVWWGPGDLTFGSWWEFVGVLQAVTDFIFGSQITATIYVVAMALLFAVLANFVIAPPDPDFVSLRQDLKEAQESAGAMNARVQELEGENKKLNEFVSQKEESLSTLQGELEAIKAEVQEREVSIAEMESRLQATASAPELSQDAEQELLQTISKKDQTISALQSEIDDLKLSLDSAGQAVPAAAVDAEKLTMLQNQLAYFKTKLDDYNRRADTAAQVSDSVISDLAELISQIQGSSIDPAAKVALAGLIENLGRAIGRVAATAAERVEGEPKIELIGAVMMVHEIVDDIKRLIRGG